MSLISIIGHACAIAIIIQISRLDGKLRAMDKIEREAPNIVGGHVLEKIDWIRDKRKFSGHDNKIIAWLDIELGGDWYEVKISSTGKSAS